MRYSAHAKLRLKQHQVTTAEVEVIIASPSRGTWVPTNRDTVEHFGASADGRPFNVVTNGAKTIVITIVSQ